MRKLSSGNHSQAIFFAFSDCKHSKPETTLARAYSSDTSFLKQRHAIRKVQALHTFAHRIMLPTPRTKPPRQTQISMHLPASIRCHLFFQCIPIPFPRYPAIHAIIVTTLNNICLCCPPPAESQEEMTSTMQPPRMRKSIDHSPFNFPRGKSVLSYFLFLLTLLTFFVDSMIGHSVAGSSILFLWLLLHFLLRLLFII